VRSAVAVIAAIEDDGDPGSGGELGDALDGEHDARQHRAGGVEGQAAAPVRLVAGRCQCMIMPVCDRVNARNTPTAYSGSRVSVLPRNPM
jgi:hypothetical protein